LMHAWRFVVKTYKMKYKLLDQDWRREYKQAPMPFQSLFYVFILWQLGAKLRFMTRLAGDEDDEEEEEIYTGDDSLFGGHHAPVDTGKSMTGRRSTQQKQPVKDDRLRDPAGRIARDGNAVFLQVMTLQGWKKIWIRAKSRKRTLIRWIEHYSDFLREICFMSWAKFVAECSKMWKTALEMVQNRRRALLTKIFLSWNKFMFQKKKETEWHEKITVAMTTLNEQRERWEQEVARLEKDLAGYRNGFDKGFAPNEPEQQKLFNEPYERMGTPKRPTQIGEGVAKGAKRSGDARAIHKDKKEEKMRVAMLDDD